MKNKAKLTLAVFTLIMLLAVTIYAAGALFTWDAPTKNEDGTPLTDLAGYTMYYDKVSRGDYQGKPDGQYSYSLDLGNVLEYDVSLLDLPKNGQTWYFAITAYDTSGNESEYAPDEQKYTTADRTAPKAPSGCALRLF